MWRAENAQTPGVVFIIRVWRTGRPWIKMDYRPWYSPKKSSSVLVEIPWQANRKRYNRKHFFPGRWYTHTIDPGPCQLCAHMYSLPMTSIRKKQQQPRNPISILCWLLLLFSATTRSHNKKKLFCHVPHQSGSLRNYTLVYTYVRSMAGIDPRLDGGQPFLFWWWWGAVV
jgi:hypothetical protein